HRDLHSFPTRRSSDLEVYVTVPVNKPPLHRGARGFVEGNGVVAIEAEHHSRAVAPAGGAWEVIPNLGRTLSAVTAWPATGEPLVDRKSTRLNSSHVKI